MLANVGIPMLFVQVPVLALSLPLLIAVEAALCRRWLSMDWHTSWKAAAFANTVSTFVGVPLVWLLLVVCQIFVGGTDDPQYPEPWQSIYAVTVQSPWLPPYREGLNWMVPAASLVLMVPSFFVTVLIEVGIYRRFAQTVDRAAEVVPLVSRATWKMHAVTYSMLVAGGLCVLAMSIAQNRHHYNPSSDTPTKDTTFSPRSAGERSLSVTTHLS